MLSLTSLRAWINYFLITALDKVLDYLQEMREPPAEKPKTSGSCDNCPLNKECFDDSWSVFHPVHCESINDWFRTKVQNNIFHKIQFCCDVMFVFNFLSIFWKSPLAVLILIQLQQLESKPCMECTTLQSKGLTLLWDFKGCWLYLETFDSVCCEK